MAPRASTRKRKAKAQQSDDEAPVKRARPTKTTPSKRTPAPRTAKAKRNDPEWLVTDEKSSLANEDLHAEFSDPKTYEGFTHQDWDDLRSTLPENVPLNPDGHSIPMDYFKYDPDFRRGIREFQEDLSSGRLDPKWQTAAAEAMEERARGEFDAYKENNYEEFWGQKQKLHWHALAGEATALKLDTMIENGTFRVGDEWFFSRVIGRKDKRVLIEKECTIVNIGQRTVDIAIPPGQLKYSHHVTRSGMPTGATPITDTDATKNGDRANGQGRGTTPPLDSVLIPDGSTEVLGRNHHLREDLQHNHESNVQSLVEIRSGDKFLLEDNGSGNVPIFEESAETVTGEKQSIDCHKTHDSAPSSMKIDPVLASSSPNKDALDQNESRMDAKDEDGGPSNGAPENPEPTEEVVVHQISTLKQLHDKVIELDGRRDPKNIKEVPAISPWKLVRAKRNNQDLGTLFDMREHFYHFKLPKIGKAPTPSPRKR